MNKRFWFFIILLGAVYNTGLAQLPQDHEYQQALRSHIGSLQAQDFEIELTELTAGASDFNSVDELYRTWLFVGYHHYYMMGTRGLRVDASHFTLDAIEANGNVNMTVGKGEFMNPTATAFWADWNYGGNPHYDSRAVKLRAFVAAAVDMMMQDRDHEGGNNARSDFLGLQLIRWAFSYGVAKDVLPQEVRQAYEKGLIKMFERLEEWGPTGIHADMDMGAIIGMLYAAKFIDSQDLTQRAHDHIDLILNRHLYDAGYIDHGGAYDAGYNGMSMYFLNWAAYISEYPPIINALKDMSKLKAYLTLPDPDGQRFSPFHSNPSSDADAPHDLWSPYYRDVGISKFSDEAKYLVYNSTREDIHDQKTMLEQLEKNVRRFHDPDREKAFTTPSDNSPGQWEHEHWLNGNSLNATAFYYQDGTYDELKKSKNTALANPPFERDENFTESFADKFLSVKRNTYGTVIFNDRLSWWTKEGQTETINGFGGGNISAFWTPSTGSVLLGGTRTNHNGGLDLKEWEIWPVHALSGETEDGRTFSSGLQRHPESTYELDRNPKKVTISGDLTNIHSDPLDGLQGQASYKRVFQLKENGLQVTTSVNADGSNIVNEIYEILPIYRRNAYRQSSTTPTAIEFKVNGNWEKAGTAFKEVASVRLTRFDGEVYIDFKDPVRAKLSSQDFYNDPDNKGRFQARNIMIDLLGSGGEPASLKNNSVSYFMRSSKAAQNSDWIGGDGSDSNTSSPNLSISHSPSNPDDTDEITFSASAEDNSGISKIEIYVNDNLEKTCEESTDCELTGGPYPEGDISYQAIAYDAASEPNKTESDVKTVSVSGEQQTGNNGPVINTPELIKEGERLYVEASKVQDEDGDSVYTNVDWRIDGESISLINYSFDVEGSVAKDSLAKDFTSYENHGKQKTQSYIPAWTSEGRKAGAYYFDGQGDHIYTPTSDKIESLKAFTIEFWMKHDNWGDEWATLVSKPFYNDKWEDPWSVFKIGRDGPRDQLNFQITVSDGKAVSIQSQSDISGDQWAHVVGTYDGKMLKLYINGELDKQIQVNEPLVSGRKTGIYLGSKWGQESKHEAYRGLMDEFRIFDRALTPQQIERHYATKYTDFSLDEVSNGEEWTALVTPTDTKAYGQSKESNPIVIEDTGDAESSELAMNQNYPNPFRSETNIEYSLPDEEVEVSLVIYNTVGKKVATLVDSETQSGVQQIPFDASDFNLSSGIYFYRLEADDTLFLKKMTYIK